MSFKVGDIIVPKESASMVYIETTKKNEVIGEVIRILDDNEIQIKILYSKIPNYDKIYCVESQYFELYSHNIPKICDDITIPNITIPNIEWSTLGEKISQDIILKNEEGENKMDCKKILDIYEDRVRKTIAKEIEEKKQKIIENDEIVKIEKEMINQINVLLENDGQNTIKTDIFSVLLKETKEQISNLTDEYMKENNELDETLREINAQLEIVSDYETAIKILKKYGVLNKDGKIND